MRLAIKAALSAVMLVGAGSAAFAQNIVTIPNIIELSGAGATVGTNWKNGATSPSPRSTRRAASSARRSRLEFVDTAEQSGQGARRHAARARRQAARDLRADLFRLGQRHAAADRRGGGAADHRRRGRGPDGAGLKYLFRTSFGQNVSMPKIANYLRDGVKAKSVAVVYVNNDFGKGGRDAIDQGAERPRHQGRGRHLDRSRPGRFRRRRHQAQGAPTPTRSSSISTRRRARASCARPRSRASTSR